MDINLTELLSGESVIISKLANSVIELKEYELKRLPYDQLMALSGFKGKEAIGGQLYLTNYRLIFKSHSLNRLRGKFSIFLPTIQETKNNSSFLSKKLEVVTQTQRFEFVVWGVPELITKIKDSTKNITSQDKEYLGTVVSSDYDNLDEGFKTFKTMDKVLRNLPDIMDKFTEIVQDPIALSSLLNAIELLNLVLQDDE
jgi:hypothetical protein